MRVRAIGTHAVPVKTGLIGLLTGVLGALLLWRACLPRARERHPGAWLPKELENATIAYSEKRFVAMPPTPLGAIVDRVYRRPDQVLVLVEFKRRDRLVVYESDIVELSVQRLAVEGASREKVSEYAYVVVLAPWAETRQTMRVRLYSKERVHHLADRRNGLLKGVVPPRKAESPGLCECCVFKAECRVIE